MMLARSDPPPRIDTVTGMPFWLGLYSSMPGPPRMPGALEMTCASPCGNAMTSPASSRTGASSMRPPQHEPAVTTWYSMTCSMPGMRCGPTSRDGGVSATQGAEPSMRK